MPFQIPDDLNRDLMPLAWMIGHWEGEGHGNTPDEGEFSFGCQVDFTDNGGDYLHYICQTFTMNPDGTPAAPLRMETGFWRPNVDTRKVDVLMAAPEGWAEVWTGNIDGAKIQRLYGQVEGDLLWTFDRATVDAPLQPYMWARLKRS